MDHPTSPIVLRESCRIAPLLLTLLVAPARGEPRYEDPAAEPIITTMVEAHGGLKRWRGAPSIHFESELEVRMGAQTVPFREKVTVDPRTRRVYAELPNGDGTGGRIAFDGRTAWSAGELRGIARAPARFTAWRNFYLFNVPWLTQDDGVIFGEPSQGSLPGDPTSYTTVPMRFESRTGDTPSDTYTLYIDPRTSRLKAYEYGMTYKSMLPEGRDAMPRSVFVREEDAWVDDLLMPKRYTVYWIHNGSVAVTGQIHSWSFDRPFDVSRLEMPPDGMPDTSVPN